MAFDSLWHEQLAKLQIVRLNLKTLCPNINIDVDRMIVQCAFDDKDKATKSLAANDTG